MYTRSYFPCLHTGDSTAPLLSAQRVSPLRFIEINKQGNFSVWSHENGANTTIDHQRWQ